MGLFDVFSSSDGKAAAKAANKATVTGLRTGEDRAMSYLDHGVAGARPLYERAIGLFDQYAQQGGQATGAYGDAIGLNGADGYDRATEAFRTGPGYQFAVDQANEAVKRNAAATGMLGSGNTLIGISDRTRGMADQEYQRYLDNLFRASGQGQTAASQQAGLITGLGDFEYGDAAARAGLAHGTETSVGAANAQKAADIYQAKQAAGGNIWNAILGVGNMAAKFMGGGA
jgi:hypothetical protein